MNLLALRMAALCLATSSIVCVAKPPSAGEPPIAGGYQKATTTDHQVVAAAAFAIQVQSSTTPKLSLSKIEEAQTQVVAGINFKLTLSVQLDGVAKQAEAVVYRHFAGEQKLTSWTWK